MKVAVFRVLAWIALVGRVYYAWSKVYQFLFEWKWRGHFMPEFDEVGALSKTVGRMEWKKDGFVQLWDAVSRPEATWGRHSKGMKAGDCDDISMFAVDRIRDMMARGRLPRVKFVGLLSCPWDDGNKIGGHNVCAVQYTRNDVATGQWLMRWAHVSNWHGGEVRGEFDDVEDVVENVVGGRTNLHWALSDHRLRLVKHGRLERD